MPSVPPPTLLCLQPLQPVVHVWDSETLLKLQEIGLGAFERGVGALAFSVAVRAPRPCTPYSRFHQGLLSSSLRRFLRNGTCPPSLSSCPSND